LFVSAELLDLYGIIPNGYPYETYFFSIVTFFEYALFCFFLSNIIKSSLYKKIILFSIPAFALFQLIYLNYSADWHFDSIPTGIETILILIFSIYYLFEEVNNPSSPFIYNNYRFWIIAGFMIYLSGSFFIFLLINYISDSQIPFYWLFIDIFLMLKNIFFTIGIIVFVLQSNFTNPYLKNFHKNSFPKP
jgi:hypothetical protein